MTEGPMTRHRTVAALYVDPVRGPYAHLPDVDPWGIDRDARLYCGPHPVVAHPPCGPWGRFYWRYRGGEGTADTAIRAVDQVRRFGGVLEHPAKSGLWGKIRQKRGTNDPRPPGIPDLPLPGEPPDRYGGYTIAVEQVRWGHPAVKPTWLYIVGVPPSQLPEIPPMRAPTHEITTKGRAKGGLPELPKKLRHITPEPFAAWLLDVARRAAP